VAAIAANNIEVSDLAGALLRRDFTYAMKIACAAMDGLRSAA
jgi:hypothetical protein